LIAVLPYFIAITTGIPSGLALGGTGLIILVTSSMELWNSIISAATTTGYNITKKKIASAYEEKEQTTQL
jgi:preprotein translocase subunit SecY